MKLRVLRLTWVPILLAAADTQFHVHLSARNDAPPGKGQCDIRLQIEGPAEVWVQGDVVSIRGVSGQDGRDNGSECTGPLPTRDLRGFHFEARDGRDRVRLLTPPSRRNDYRAVVHIQNGAGGGPYQFRLTWTETTAQETSDLRGTENPKEGGGLTWNNTTHIAGRGRGLVTRTGSSEQNLLDVSVDIDRGGRVLVAFRTDHRQPVRFSGSVISTDGDTLKADVATEDSVRLRGSLYLSRNVRGDAARITLEATNGQERLHLDWSAAPK